MRRCPITGKIAYATRKRAVKARDHSNAVRHPLDPEVNFMYRCPTCSRWHLTKQPQEEARHGRSAHIAAGEHRSAA